MSDVHGGWWPFKDFTMEDMTEYKIRRDIHDEIAKKMLEYIKNRKIPFDNSFLQIAYIRGQRDMVNEIIRIYKQGLF
jgi:hypothetical protein